MEDKNLENEPKTISPEEIGQAVGETTVEAPVEQPVEAPAVEQAQPEVAAAAPVAEKVEEEKAEVKKENKKGLVIALVLVVLLAALAALYFLVLKPSQKETKKESTDVKEVLSEYRMTGNDLQAFDLYFLQLENEAKNKVYSPLSIKYALAMLSEGAKGETKEQIDNIIGEYKANKYPNNEHMSFANAMFIRDTYKEAVKEEYINTLKDKYNAEVILDQFASPTNINNWVSNKTFKLINNLVDDVSGNDFFLINALAIDMNWNYKIQAEYNGSNVKNMTYGFSYVHEDFNDAVPAICDVKDYPELKFNGTDGIKAVEVAATFNHYDIIKDKGEEAIKSTIKPDYEKYLQEHPDEGCPPVDQYLNEYVEEIKTNYKQADQSTDFYINDTDDVKVFGKDLQTYDGKTLQYVGIMPKKQELTEYVEKLDAKAVQKLISDMKVVQYDSFEEGVVTHIKGKIPLFKYDYELALEKDLKKLGVKNIFSDADLSNMVEGEAAINKAIHKANIEFNNEGIKAGAATAMGGLGAASGGCQYDYLFKVPVKEIDITFDKPYMYVIRDKESGEVWFTGTVYEPIKK